MHHRFVLSVSLLNNRLNLRSIKTFLRFKQSPKHNIEEVSERNWIFEDRNHFYETIAGEKND